MQLEKIVPWGRSYLEYRQMFALTETDLARRILGCGDGPAAFNAGLTARGGAIVSVDPLYVVSPQLIRQRIAATAEAILDGVQRHRERYCWDRMVSPAVLRRTRLSAMETFLADYETRTAPSRYVAGALPDLPFRSATFGLALCSHLLFTYSDHLDQSFHRQAVTELLRVAHEVRLFPILTVDSRPSPHLGPLRQSLAEAGHSSTLEPVPYEFQRGGHQMLRIRHGARKESLRD